jgi:hypothetical protein
MQLRIVGGILVLVGAAVLGMGIWGIAAANSMAQRLSWVAAQNGRGFDAEAWVLHWRISGGIVALIGALVFAGGTATLLKKVWGLIGVSLAGVTAATYPWVLQISGYARYSFEAAHLLETLIYIAVASAAMLTYALLRKRAIGTN